MLFVEQKYKVDEIENGRSHTQFWQDEPCVSARIRVANYK